MHPSPRHLATIGALTAALVLTSLAPVSAAWAPTKIIRSISAGELLTAEDMAGLGSRVLVGWEQEGATQKAFMRWSLDGGNTWKATRRLDTRPIRELQVDTCKGWAWGVAGLHVPEAPAGEWLISLDGYKMNGSPHEASILTLSGQSRTPDIACAGGKRLAVAWFRKVSGGHRVKFFSRGILLNPLGDNPPEVKHDLGMGNLQRGLSVAATKDRIYVAWFKGDNLMLRRYGVGAAPNFPITHLGTQSLGSYQYGNYPRLGAAGGRVALAYMNRADLVVRVSANRGVSWGAQRTLRDEPFPSEIAASPTNVDVRGSRILVSGIEQGGIETPSGKGFLYQSNDGGGSWAQVTGSVKNGSRVVGAFMSPGGVTKRAMAWDDALNFEASLGPQELRFRRQS